VAALINHGTTGSNPSAHPSTSGSSAQSSQPFSSPPRPSNPAQQTTPIVPTVPENPPDTQEQPQQAITDYYALMPQNLPAGWKRLTANYQQNHAGGFPGYQSFWNTVQRVVVVDISANQNNSVDATIDYIFKDGRVVEERTNYRLVTEDGLRKIDSSTVQSSYTKQAS
jgi:hypothetical protein